ncbi:hypothetical protein ACS5PJ_20335 [Pseudarthrobacter sp. YS3]|uniref:hypothetical protein n=1 Tax=Pseudarthrobacter sp. YS3 TaxID=3453718 RepID=UPI003EEECE05
MQIANIQDKDRARGLRATLGFIQGDSLALDAVLTEAAEDPTPGATAALVLAVTEQAAMYANAAPDAVQQLQSLILDYVQQEANRG